MASGCPKCSFPLERKRRSLAERLLFRRLWICRACGTQIRAWRVPFESTVHFLRSPYTRCIACGNPRVRHLVVRDRIDQMSVHPVSVLLGLARMPLYHCNACRHQYHDWRQVHPDFLERRPAIAVDLPMSPAAKDAAAREHAAGAAVDATLEAP